MDITRPRTAPATYFPRGTSPDCTILMAASNALAKHAPMVQHGEGALLPALSDIREISQSIAFDVAKMAQHEGKALECDDDVLWASIERNFWYPRYREYRRRAF